MEQRYVDAHEVALKRHRCNPAKFKLPYKSLDWNAEIPHATQEEADRLFDERISKAKVFHKRDAAKKREAWHSILRALKRAHYLDQTVAFPRRHDHPDWSKARMNVIDAAIESGLCTENRGQKGGHHLTRLMPAQDLQPSTTDPWEFDMQTTSRQLVFIHPRDHKETARETGRQEAERKQEGGQGGRTGIHLGTLVLDPGIPFDPDHPVARRFTRCLTLINRINSGHDVRYRQFDPDLRRGSFTTWRRLRPIHYARFTDNFETHGRIYTGQFGHQTLRKVERQTITISGTPTIELDFQGMHCRMLYHLEGIRFTKDPYQVWGKATTEALRLMVKKLVNALLNAKGTNAALSSCYLAMRDRDADGKEKTGRELEDAYKLRKAVDRTRLSFKDLVPLVLNFHSGIAQHLEGGDMGIKLMNHDGRIALDVMTAFAKRAIPILGCHDSFLVPARYEEDLREVMMRCYKKRMGFYPEIK